MSSRISSTLTDREGVAIVQRIVARDLRWLFREQFASDQGIDGQVEVAAEGHGTGRLIAIQIKSGRSYFRSVTGGWSFYYSERERQLWLGHALPVMVVLVDVDAGAAYWQRISAATERRTKKGYAVTIPAAQTLESAAEAWERAASGMEQRASERYETNLNALPPRVGYLIREESSGRLDSELLALHLAEGRQNPVGTAQALLAARPSWMGRPWSWHALGVYSALHEAPLESADSLEIAAADGGNDAGRRLAAAALHIASLDESRALTLIDAARNAGGADVLVAIVEAILEHPTEDGLPLRDEHVRRAGGAAIDGDATAQAFLAENSLRRGDLASAARHAEHALELDPDDSDAMARAARVYTRRSVTPEAQANDAERAVELLAQCVLQRRLWSGPTFEILRNLASLLIVQEDFSAVLRWLLPAPYGSATPAEANEPALLRCTLTAAAMSDQSELASSISKQMGDSIQDRVARNRLGLLELDEDGLAKLWTDELDRAESEQDWAGIAQAVYRLATLGIDRVRHLDALVDKGAMSQDATRLPVVLLALRADPTEGLVRLRALAAEDLGAAEHLVGALLKAGRRDEAVDACAQAFEKFRAPIFLRQRAFLLADSGSPLAETALNEALVAERSPKVRVAIATRLAQFAAGSGAWVTAEAQLVAALSYVTPPPDELVWNVVHVQLGGSAGDRAASTLSRYRPRCRNEADARLWSNAMAHVPWDDKIASEAIALATRFFNHPEVATSLLARLVLGTRGTPPDDAAVASDEPEDDERPLVRGELHKQAFEVLGKLIETHGEASGLRFIDAPDPATLMERIAEELQRLAPPGLHDLQEQIARAQVPAGLLAIISGRTYSEALVRRAAGQLVAVPTDDLENDEEVSVAGEAQNGTVVMDLSALLILSRISESDALSGRVSSMIVPRETRADIGRAALEVQTLGASRGSLGWDLESQRPVFHQQTSAEYRMVRARMDALETSVRRTTVRDAASTHLLEDLPAEVRSQPWFRSIELAFTASAPLWCDDLAVRRLARSLGVEAFSTLALAEVVRDARLDAAKGPEEVERAIDFAANLNADLMAEFVVDVPVTFEQLEEQAGRDDWVPAAAGLVVSRPAWWASQEDPIGQVLRLYEGAKATAPEQLGSWQLAVMLGAARAQGTLEGVCQILARLALLGLGPDLQSEPPMPDLLAGCRNAQRVAAMFDGAGDPLAALPGARAVLLRAGVPRDESLVERLIRECGEVGNDA